MSEFSITNDYSASPEKVWRALTDPELVALWTTTGQGGKPVGFEPIVGTHFKFVATPLPGWNGIVECEVLEVRAPSLLRYTWRNGDDDAKTIVTCRVEPRGSGTRFTWEHTGFTGVGGFMMSKLLASVRRKMLSVGLPAVLEKVT